jgi:Flp pilus assembly protein TadD
MKHNVKSFFVIALAGLVLASCNPLKKMAKNSEYIKYSINPNPLEMHNDSVTLNATGKVPPEYFHKLATVTITPVLKNANDEVVKEYKPITLVGSEVEADGQKVDFTKGGDFQYNETVAYDKSMENVTLWVTAKAGFKTKEITFDERKIGDGTIITPYWVQNDDKPILGADNFKKVIPHAVKAQINYAIQSHVVRSPELRDEDMKKFNEFVDMAVENEFVFKNVSISAYASPDGESELNENLATNRAESAEKAIARILRKEKVDAAKEEGFFKLEGKGEDWAGFEAAVKASDIEDKDLILNVLKMQSDLSKREEEIKHMSKTYVELAEKILPELRRSQITLNADEMSRTDEEIKQLASSNDTALSVEELLYAATLTNDIDEQLKIYNAVKKNYPKDWRGPNNVGYIHILKNNIADAKAEFEAAESLNAGNPVVSNNLGIVARINGDREKAAELLSKAAGAGPEVNYNLGIIAIQNGDYAKAVSKMGGEKTVNAGLAKLLNGDTDGAIEAIDGSANKETAAAYYLKAVAGARSNNKELMMKNLKLAISKDASLKEKALNDAEFLSFRADDSFTAALK